MMTRTYIAQTFSVLLIEDNPGDARLFGDVLNESDLEVELRREASLSGGIASLDEYGPDVIVVGLGLPDSEGPETVRRLVKEAPNLPVVVVTGQETIERATKALDAGATEYLRTDELLPELVARSLRSAVERKRTEGRLREREAQLRRCRERYQSLFRDSNEAILAHTLDGTIEEANPKAESLFGLTADELRGRALESLYAPGEEETVPEKLGALRDGEPFSAVSRYKRADGSEFWGELSASVSQIDGEDLARTMIRDVSDRVREERRRKDVVRRVTDAIVKVDADWQFSLVNDQAEELYDMSEEELLGKHFWNVFEAAKDTPFETTYRKVMETREPGRLVEHYPEFGGWFEVQVYPDEDGGLAFYFKDVTERKEREEALRRQRNLLEQTQRLSGAWEVNLATNEVSWSDEVYRIHEVSPGTAIDVDEAIEFYVGEARPTVREAFERCVVEGEPYDLELPLVTAKGNRRWVRTVGAPIEGEDDEIVKVAGAFQDITDRKQAEETLRKERDRFETLFQNLPTPVVHGVPDEDARLRIRAVNRAFETVFGLAKEDVEGEDVQELIVPDDEQADADSIRRRLLAGKPVDQEVRRRAADGIREFRVQVTLREDDSGPVEGYAIYTDITEEKRAQRRLEEQERQLQQIKDNVTEVVWISTPKKEEMKFISDAYEDIWGRPPQSVTDRPTSFVEAIHPDDRERIRAALEVQQSEPESYDETYRVVQPDGEIRWVHDRAAGVYDEHGELQRIVGVATDITEAKEYEIELETLTTRLQLALEATNTGIFDWDIETDEVIWDESSERLFGYEPGAFPGTYDGWADRVHPDDLPQAEADVASAMENREEYQTEFRVRVPDGPQRWIQARGVVEYAKDGSPSRMLGIHTDVTERKRKEQALREERDLLERIFEISPVAIVLFDRDGDFVRASDRAEEVLGLQKDQVTARSYNDPEWDITTPEGEPIPDDELPFARVISTGEPVYGVEHTIVWPDDTRRLLSVSGAPLRDREGGIEGAVFHIEDVTERRAAERRLRQSEQRFRKIFENAAVGIVIGNSEGRVIRANPAFQQMMGYSQEELQGRHFQEFTHPDDSALNRRRFRELQEGVRTRDQGEKRYVRKDGSTFWGRLTVSLFEGVDEGHHISLIEDIDKQKQYEENLRAAKAEAEEAARLKSAMLANMSHELRTPLTSIIGFSELLAGELRDEQGELAERIHRSSRRLMNTLNSVLQLSRLEAGTVELERESVQLEQLTKDTIDVLETEAKAKTVDLEYTPPDGSVAGKWNEEAVRQIIQNLVDNAIKFTAPGGTVEVTLRDEESRAIVTVEDSGIGISEKAQDTIFDAFKQESEGLGREFEGSGLGLSITMRLVEAHGGTIDVESEKGVGSRFTVSLPFHDGGDGA